MQFKKILGEKQTGSVFKNGVFYPYTVEYIGEDEDGGGSIFHINFLMVDQGYLEEDLDIFFNEVVYSVIDTYLEESKKEKQLLNIRLFKRDVDFLKKYAEQNGSNYQSIIRDFVHERVEKLSLS